MKRFWALMAAGSLAFAIPAVTATTRAAAAPAGDRSGSRALLVCNGSTSPCPDGVRHYRTVQAAVEAARPGDWVLIWPGVYHEKSAKWPTAGVWIQTSHIHIRGLNRNRVIIDGSNGSARHPCPSSPRLQDDNHGLGRDGVVVWKANGVTIQNLTVCDYLSGSGGHGNEIWWNGGDGSGKIGLRGYGGSYLTATSMYHPANIHAPNLPQYGIFVSNSSRGAIRRSYASNMADAAYYVGACQRVCHATLAFDRGSNSALGYSGTNAGGRLVIRSSVFDHNRTGLAPNSLNNDDSPPPQDGRCLHSLTASCMFIEHNLIIDNNNANAPTSGLMPAVGTGIEISGGSYDTVRGNRIVKQGAWGIVVHDYPDFETPPPLSHCQGGVQITKGLCVFPAVGNLVCRNVFARVGFFGNVTNSDLATTGLLGRAVPRNCFFSNRARGGKLTSAPTNIQMTTVDGRPCGKPGTLPVNKLIRQLVCATGAKGLPITCPKGSRYPKQTKIVIAPLPKLRSMPHPCAGVPANGFCAAALPDLGGPGPVTGR